MDLRVLEVKFVKAQLLRPRNSLALVFYLKKKMFIS